MQQIINFLIRNKNFLLFLLLFCLSLFFTFQSHSYHKSKFINSANFLTGGVYESVNGIGQYFNLIEENQKLLDENNHLKSILFNAENELKDDFALDSTVTNQYEVVAAQVYKNSFSATRNYLTINKGKRDSIQEDYGVITSNGIVGIIDNTSKNYSRVLSVLNTNSRINALLKNSNHFGPLRWDGKSPDVVQLTDIQGLAKISVGDTVTTSGYSTTFPKGINIGEVISFHVKETEDVYTINVKLFNDMTNIKHVYIIKNNDAAEISKLNNPNE